MARLLSILGWALVSVLLLAHEGQAQQIQACVPSKTLVNVAGNLTDIIVPSTPVIVLSINQAACQRLISNVGTASMRCLPSNQGPPSPTQGLLIVSGSQFLMGTEGRDEWKCIATTATPTVATTIEGLP